jgi:hypothetical protein
MPTFTVTQCRQWGIPMETRVSSRTALASAELLFKMNDETRALVERGRRSSVEYTVPAEMTLIEVAALTLGDGGHWAVLGLLNQHIEDLCKVPNTLSPGLVLRIPAPPPTARVFTTTVCEPELPPTHRSSTNAAMQQPLSKKSGTSPLQTLCNARMRTSS